MANIIKAMKTKIGIFVLIVLIMLTLLMGITFGLRAAILELSFGSIIYIGMLWAFGDTLIDE